MIGFVVSVFRFLVFWFILGVFGALVDWWGFTQYLTVTLGWMGDAISFVFGMARYIGEQWRAIN